MSNFSSFLSSARKTPSDGSSPIGKKINTGTSSSGKSTPFFGRKKPSSLKPLHQPKVHNDMCLQLKPNSPGAMNTKSSSSDGSMQDEMEEMRSNFGKLFVDDKEYDMKAENLECGDVIGAGTFGSVKSVFHKQAKKLFAVKYLFDSIQTKERQKIIKELSLSSRFVSDYTVRYYGINMVEGQIELFMELMRLSLDKMIVRASEVNAIVPEAILGKITCSLIRGLDYMWEKHRAMHRDVKPKNVLVGYDGSIKLCDFGLANIAVESMLISNVGSELYLSPESLLTNGPDAPYDVRRDVWSLGTTLLEVANLEYPFKIKTPTSGKKVALFDTMLFLRSGEVPPARDVYSRDFQELVSSCLEVDVTLRPYFRVGSQPQKRLGSSSSSHPSSRQNSLNSSSWGDSFKKYHVASPTTPSTTTSTTPTLSQSGSFKHFNKQEGQPGNPQGVDNDNNDHDGTEDASVDGLHQDEKKTTHPALMEHAFFLQYSATDVNVTEWLDNLFRDSQLFI